MIIIIATNGHGLSVCLHVMAFDFHQSVRIKSNNIIYIIDINIISVIMSVLSRQSCPTLCDPMDCSPPGSSVHGILQSRTLEWDAICFSRGSSEPRDQTQVSFISCIGKWVLYHQQYHCNYIIITVYQYIIII